MKTLLTLTLFVFSFSIVKSQNLSREETVNYINGIFKNGHSFFELTFECDKYGNVKITESSEYIYTFNINDVNVSLKKCPTDEDCAEGYALGITCIKGECIIDRFKPKNTISKTNERRFYIATKDDMNKLVKAFNHLKSLGLSDPFSK